MKKIVILLITLILVIPTSVYASNQVLRDHIINNNPLRTGADFTNISDNSNRDTQEGLFSTPDDFGTSFFFRGTHDGLNNNVIFAGHQWKILRIEGNGNIRMIYNGPCPNNSCTINGNEAGNAATIGTSGFNSNGHNRFVGYMFGSITGSFNEQHANTNNSIIKTAVDTWFSTNITGTNRNLVASDTIFCVDRSFRSTNTGTGLGATPTQYATSERTIATADAGVPTLLCTRVEDKLSINNGLTYPVGLITHDEANFAGGRGGSGMQNPDFFLRTNEWFWTMSPNQFNAMGAMVLSVLPTGILGGGASIVNPQGIRPVLSLDKCVTATGDGSLDTPYVITGIGCPSVIPPDNGNQNNNNNNNLSNNENNYNPQTSVPSLLAFTLIATISAATLIILNRKKI